jgi:hypothetical protein
VQIAGRQRGVEMLTADIVEIDVDPVLAEPLQRGE